MGHSPSDDGTIMVFRGMTGIFQLKLMDDGSARIMNCEVTTANDLFRAYMLTEETVGRANLTNRTWVSEARSVARSFAMGRSKSELEAILAKFSTRGLGCRALFTQARFGNYLEDAKTWEHSKIANSFAEAVIDSRLVLETPDGAVIQSIKMELTQAAKGLTT